jgi:hypothetical protein
MSPQDRNERRLYRILEIFPGALSWGSIFSVFLFSWLQPFWVAIFILLFVLYWFFRTIYLSFHLRSAFYRMKEYEKIDWLKRLEKLFVHNPHLPAVSNWRDIYHLIILPMYKESLEIVRGSFFALWNSDYPKDRMIVVLACEESVREEVEATAFAIEQEFGKRFFQFMVTWHPVGIPGEIPGKGSNETWAAKRAKEKFIDPFKIPLENIIFSSFDVDTAVFQKYFSCLTYHYLTADNPTRTSFQPIPLFINNIWQAPSFSRLFAFSTTFWQMMNQERPEKLLTFSSHSMSFKALVEIGFKQVGVVSDDSRIFWQCFLHYDGEYRVQPLYYPIAMDANAAENFWRTLKNLYRQQRRWAYGAGDIPYFLFGFIKNRKIKLSRKLLLGFELIEGHWSWATAPILIFLLGWLPIFLGGQEFSQTLLGYNLPRMVSFILTIAMIGLVTSAFLSIQLLPPRPPSYGKWKYVLLIAEWFLLPIMMIFFTALPALDAQTRLMLGKYMGFWPTPKYRKF